MVDGDLVRFQVDASQYGDFRSSLRAILGTETTEPGIPVEVQLIMYLKELTLYPGRSSSQDAKELAREVSAAEPRYMIRGRILERELYWTEWEDGSREVIESLVDASVPIVVLADSRSEGVEHLKSGEVFDAVGILHGELAWHDGRIFRPIRGLIQEVRESPLVGSSRARYASVRLRVDPSCKPFRKVTWIMPGVD